MSWKIRYASLPFMAVAAVMLITTQAFAIPLVFDNGVNTQGPFTNPGPPPVDKNFFVGNFQLQNGSSLQIGGNFNFNFQISANLGLTGATGSVSGNLNVPYSSNSVTLQGGGLKINSKSTGTATLTLWDEQVNGFDPGGDGGNPSKNVSFPPSVLTGADLTNLNVTLVQPGGPTAQTNTISFSGSGGIPVSLFGLASFDIPVAANFTGKAVTGIDHIGFQQTSGDALTVQTAFPAKNAPDQTTTYLMAGSPLGQNNGVLDAGLNLGINGSAQLSILGINVTTVPLNFSDTLNLNTDFLLPGVATLADLNPTGYNPVNYDDLQVTLGLTDGGGGGVFAVDFPLASSGTATIVSTATFTTNLVAPMTITANFSGTITFGILATLNATNVGYQLQDSVAGVVAPEPGSIVLLFVGVAGALPLVIRRIRRKR
jgi:hypothetical protein